MIPTIETIVENLLAGTCTKHEAIEWLHQHAADAGVDLLDGFAVAALQGLLAGHYLGHEPTPSIEASVAHAYAYGKAMLAERAK